VVPELASRLSGSSDIYAWSDRRAYASINFVTAHDGYTLRDLVSYEQKHNEANGEQNRDGHDNNISHNWGVEGETRDATVTAMRHRAMRSMLATLAFSQGVPMLSHGDEIGRTQRGNNNAYAQDNEISWVDWRLEPWQRQLLSFTRKLFAIRHANPVLRRRSFFRGRPVGQVGAKDLTWLRADGREMTDADWHAPEGHTLGMLISGEAADETDERGRPVRGDTMLLLLNAGAEATTFTIPAWRDQGAWVALVDTEAGDAQSFDVVDTGVYTVAPFSLALLRHGANRRISSLSTTLEGAATAVNVAAVAGGAGASWSRV
jgi:glycogen operon protein